MGRFTRLLRVLGSRGMGSLSPSGLGSCFLCYVAGLGLSRGLLRDHVGTVGFCFRRILGGSGVVLQVPEPGGIGRLPGILGGGEVTGVFSTAVGPGRGLVLGLTCNVNLHMDRVIDLQVGSVSSRQVVIRVGGTGKGGSHVMALPRDILSRVHACCGRFRPGGFLFRKRCNKGCTAQDIRTIFGGTLMNTKVQREVNVRTLQRDCTARLLRYKASVSLVRGLVKRGSVGAALNCARMDGGDVTGMGDPLSGL